jgi:hypothetical protein
MKRKSLLFMIFTSSILIFLTACGQNKTISSTAWTEQEVDNVFDLSELGQLAQNEAGKLTVGGKFIGEDSLSGLAYGRSYNLLRLSDDVLNSMSYSQREYFINATPDQLRSDLKALGYTPGGFRKKVGIVNETVTLKNLQDSGLYSSLKSISFESVLAPLAYDITGKSDFQSYALQCTTLNPRPTDYRIRAISSTTSTSSSNYLRTQTSLTIAGLFVAKYPQNVSTTSNGPTSSDTAQLDYRYTCLRPTAQARVSGWHKGKQTSTSTAIIKTSSR